MASQGQMTRAVAAALRGIKRKDPRDEGARALARKYAGLIDAPAIPERYRKPLELLESAATAAEDPAVLDAYYKIASALAATTVASDLGPKLLAALAALGLTTAARGVAEGGGPDAGASSSTVVAARDEVAEQRRRRAAAAG